MSQRGNYDALQQAVVARPASPNISVSIDPSTSTPEQAAGMLHSIQSIYSPPPMPMPQTDPYGTPMTFLQMPDTHDAQEDKNMSLNYSVVSRMSMLSMRMKWGPFGERGDDMFLPQIPFDHLTIHKGADKHIIFLVVRGEPVTLTDNSDLFPSDALVTQLRMLAESKPEK